jgi:hypothetical protein
MPFLRSFVDATPGHPSLLSCSRIAGSGPV